MQRNFNIFRAINNVKQSKYCRVWLKFQGYNNKYSVLTK
jgi:hypothetical protein